jgi:hypothetical protein
VLVWSDDDRDEHPLLADLGRWWGEAVTLAAAFAIAFLAALPQLCSP